jgi:1-deoxy-D-xylulose-5-phosphate reductoisomerase
MTPTKNLAIFGSTGSIGCSTLDIVEMYPDRFKAVVLCAKTNVETLAKQIRRFRPEVAVVYDETHAERLKALLEHEPMVDIMFGKQGYAEAASYPSVDVVVSAVVGAAGLIPTLTAIEAGKDIALANKETLVMAGHLVMEKAREKNAKIIPVDSEHSAIFQSMAGNRRQDVRQIYLTASGGPFRNLPRNEFAHITKAQALDHPNWRMGPKITIDSATLMNKGLEVIEARWLFDLPQKDIEIVIHPQSIIHSMVGYQDGSVIAQMGKPDMKAAIAYALSYPERIDIRIEPPDFPKIGNLTFEKPDLDKFPCLRLAIESCSRGGTFPAVLNAANEIAVEAFLEDRVSFSNISRVIEEVLSCHTIVDDPSLDIVIEADQWARNTAGESIIRLH